MREGGLGGQRDRAGMNRKSYIQKKRPLGDNEHVSFGRRGGTSESRGAGEKRKKTGSRGLATRLEKRGLSKARKEKKKRTIKTHHNNMVKSTFLEAEKLQCNTAEDLNIDAPQAKLGVLCWEITLKSKKTNPTTVKTW